jgi:hypothetical protein
LRSLKANLAALHEDVTSFTKERLGRHPPLWSKKKRPFRRESFSSIFKPFDFDAQDTGHEFVTIMEVHDRTDSGWP